jgi:RNA polymerase sigma-70 factor, ECF subfamily
MSARQAATGVISKVQPKVDRQDEEQLVLLAKKGDNRAWALIFDQYYVSLYRYAFVRLRSREEAEDVASQAFLNAFAAIEKFEYRKDSLLPWLYTITRNVVNKRMRTPYSFDGEDVLEVIPGAGHSEEDLVTRLDLTAAIGKLKEEQREVVLLRFILGMSIRETAALVRKSEAAVHSLQVRAFERLRGKLPR